MGEMQVTGIGPHHFEVEIGSRRSGSSFRVTVPPEFAADLDVPGVDDVRLVEQSFAFLLEREPATSILKEFALPTISRYFPGYLDDMRRRLR